MANVIAVFERGFLFFQESLAFTLLGVCLVGRDKYGVWEATIAFKLHIFQEVRLFKGLRLRVNCFLVLPEGI